jgi:hypothetical protein
MPLCSTAHVTEQAIGDGMGPPLQSVPACVAADHARIALALAG